MELKVDIKDHDKVQIKLDKLSYKLVPSLFRVLVKGAMDTRNEMITSMQNSPATGRKYPSRRNDGTMHTASSPYFPPRPDTGDLIASIIPDVREDKLEVEVGSIINEPPYPIYLEKGSESTNLEPRPYAWDALEKIFPQIKDDIINVIVNLL